MNGVREANGQEGMNIVCLVYLEKNEDKRIMLFIILK